MGEPNYLRHSDMSNESRAAFAVRVAKELKSQAGEQFLKEILEALEKLWEQGHADREDLARLLKALTDHGLKRPKGSQKLIWTR
jgi:hypothetical protein